jgi:MoaA/NifB/PqqE/SkfB family radical SAM enzyme
VADSLGGLQPLDFPARISVEVTNRCNQTCRLCPRAGFTRPLGTIEPELFRTIADEVASHGSVLWLHFLGEPLLHPRLIDLITYAKEVGVASVGLSSNATLLSDRMAGDLLASGIDRLDFSLDANDRASYHHMRGTDDFERVTANIRSFLERRAASGSAAPVVSLQFMLTPELERSIDGIRSTWEPLLGPADFLKTIVPAPFHGAVDQGALPEDGPDRPPCPWLFGALMVLQDGSVTMCGADWDGAAPLGDLRRSTIRELWTGEEMQRRRRAHLEARFGDVDLCGSCTDWHLADGHGYQNALPGRTSKPGPVTVMLRRP